MTRALVVTHGQAVTVGNGLLRLAKVAAEHGVELVLPEIELRKHDLRGVPCVVGEGEEGGDADLVVVLGGDGTTLRALHRVLGTETPVFAVNYGRVGFLTTAPAAELEPAVARAFRGDYVVVDLATLELSQEGRRVGLAVNDAVVTSAIHGRMAHLGWRVSDVDMGEVGCDAAVVATPSGSTAYSLSAGGPVLGWGLDGFCVTFVAPHSLTARSLVLPRSHRIELRNRGEGVGARIVLDGQVVAGVLEPGGSVAVQLASEVAHLALLPEVSFLQRFRETFAPR